MPALPVSRAFPRLLSIKNPPANAGDPGLIPKSGRSPGVGNGNPLQYSCLDKSPWTEEYPWTEQYPWTEEPGGLQSMGLQRVRHDWVTEYHQSLIRWDHLWRKEWDPEIWDGESKWSWEIWTPKFHRTSLSDGGKPYFHLREKVFLCTDNFQWLYPGGICHQWMPVFVSPTPTTLITSVSITRADPNTGQTRMYKTWSGVREEINTPKQS